MRGRLLFIAIALICSVVVSVEDAQTATAKDDAHVGLLDSADALLFNADLRAEDVNEHPFALESDLTNNNALQQRNADIAATSATIEVNDNATTVANVNEQHLHTVTGFVMSMGGVAIVILALVFKKQRGRKQVRGMILLFQSNQYRKD